MLWTKVAGNQCNTLSLFDAHQISPFAIRNHDALWVIFADKIGDKHKEATVHLE